MGPLEGVGLTSLLAALNAVMSARAQTQRAGCEQESGEEAEYYDDEIVVKTTTVKLSASAVSAMVSALFADVRSLFGPSSSSVCICGAKAHDPAEARAENAGSSGVSMTTIQLAVDAWVKAHEKPDGSLDRNDMIEAVDGVLNMLPRVQWYAAHSLAQAVVPTRHWLMFSEIMRERTALRGQPEADAKSSERPEA